MFESLIFNADNWFVAQDIVLNAIDDDVILESPYGSLLRVVDLETTEVNITLLVGEADTGESLPYNLSVILFKTFWETSYTVAWV